MRGSKKKRLFSNIFYLYYHIRFAFVYDSRISVPHSIAIIRYDEKKSNRKKKEKKRRKLVLLVFRI